MVNGTLLNFGKRYDNLKVLFYQWLKLQLGLDALSNQKILKCNVGRKYEATHTQNNFKLEIVF